MIRLENTTGSSNKFYELVITIRDDKIAVIGQYGAIGKAPTEHVIYVGDDLKKAERALEKKKLEKIKNGYVQVPQ